MYAHLLKEGSDTALRLAASFAVKDGEMDLARQVIDACSARSRSLVMVDVAERGLLDLLVYLVEVHHTPVGEYVVGYASCGGHMECLRYLVEQCGAPAQKRDVCWTAEKGQMDCLRYLVEGQQCPVSPVGAASSAAQGGHVDCLRYLIEDCGVVVDTYVVESAARGGDMRCVCYLVEDCGASVCEEALYCATSRGDVECLAYLVGHYSSDVLPKSISLHAARCGELECLRYLLEECCMVIDESVALQAMRHSELECLRYLSENLYPMPLLVSRDKGSILEWAKQHRIFTSDEWCLCCGKHSARSTTLCEEHRAECIRALETASGCCADVARLITSFM